MKPQNEPVFLISNIPTLEEMDRIQAAVESDKHFKTHGEYYDGGVGISLAVKDAAGKIVGGVLASTVYRVMHLEVLWVDEKFRRQGYGSQLVLGAEQIGLEKGCLTAQTWTFSFQGPGFYPTIGYRLIGVYDGYPNGITEHAFMKRLHPDPSKSTVFEVPDSKGFYLTAGVSEADEKTLHQGLHQHVIEHVGDGYKGIEIKLVARDQAGELVGGLSAWTTLQNLIFDHIWIEERFRGRGLGRRLMQEMEKIAKDTGCIASQASCFSIQSLGFFEKMGYKILGVSDGYPPPVREYYLVKKYAG